MLAIAKVEQLCANIKSESKHKAQGHISPSDWSSDFEKGTFLLLPYNLEPMINIAEWAQRGHCHQRLGGNNAQGCLTSTFNRKH